MKFELRAEKLVPLTEEDLVELGWEFRSQTYITKTRVYQKGNFWVMLCNDRDIPYIRIAVIDCTLINWMHDPERFSCTFKQPTRSQFEIIQALIT
jgi:hypothetical protein